MAQTHTPEYRSSWIVWLAADLMLVLLFAASGRTTHASGLTAGGILATAGISRPPRLRRWTAVRAWRLPGRVWPTGLAVWIGTAGGGLLLAQRPRRRGSVFRL
jgi:hypothetical protein